MASVMEERRTATFDDFYRQTYTRLGKAMYLLTLSPSDADDLAQEAMLRVCERWSSVGSMGEPAGYAFTVAMNLFRSWVKDAKTRRELTFDPAAATSDDQARLEILSALSHVSHANREALVLVAWLGFSIEEASEILGATPGAIRVRLHRGRKELHTQLGEYDG